MAWIVFNIYFWHCWVFLIICALCGATAPKEQRCWVTLSHLPCVRCSCLPPHADHMQQSKMFCCWCSHCLLYDLSTRPSQIGLCCLIKDNLSVGFNVPSTSISKTQPYNHSILVWGKGLQNTMFDRLHLTLRFILYHIESLFKRVRMCGWQCKSEVGGIK